jgi:microcystin-dependent protein
MGTPFVGEIRCFGFNFAPVGWAFCDGQLMAIADNEVLFQLIGTTYGGDGQSTFQLPNLQGRIPMHSGTGPGGFNTIIGQINGTPTVTLNSTQMPIHAHTVVSELIAPGGVNEHVATPTTSAFIGQSAPDQVYNTSPAINAPFSPLTIGSSGGSQPHDNMQPYLALNFCISLFGVFPSQN